jgi:hypothetical protein
MKCVKLDTLPDVARRSAWARLLEMDASTFWRAEKEGKLISSRPGSKTVLYTKTEILNWLGLK